MVVSQGFLAGAVAGALGSFCELDESLVESRLVTKSRISFTDLRLKPRIIKETDQHAVELNGTIKSGVFKWKWSSKGLLKKSTLTFSGVRISLKTVTGADRKEEENTMKTTSSSLSDDAKKKGKKSWKDKFVENIIEQLSFKIEDVKVEIDLPRNAREKDIPWTRQMVVLGKDIELKSLGRAKDPKKFINGTAFKRKKAHYPILQHFCIGSISASILRVCQNGVTQVLPLIHPFQYFARVKRVHGARFESFKEGLEVSGEKVDPSRPSPSLLCTESLRLSDSVVTYESISSGKDSVEVYADNEEVEVSVSKLKSNTVGRLSEIISSSLILSESQNDLDIDQVLEPSDELRVILCEEQLTALFSLISMFQGGENKTLDDFQKETVQRNGRKKFVGPGGLIKVPSALVRNTRCINKSSKFELPFSLFHLELPNHASVRASCCEINIQVDEIHSTIGGNGGVSIDDKCVLDDGTSWCVDINKKVISINPKGNNESQSHWEWKKQKSSEEEEEPHLHLNLKDLRSVSQGLAQIYQIRSSLSPSSSKSGPKSARSSDSGQGWSLSLNGSSSFNFS